MKRGYIGLGRMRLPRLLAYPLCLLGGAMLATLLLILMATLTLTSWEMVEFVDQYHAAAGLAGAGVALYLLYRQEYR